MRLWSYKEIRYEFDTVVTEYATSKDDIFVASEGSNLRNDYAPRRDVGDTFICHQYQSIRVK